MILITGANSGLGKELCIEYAAKKMPLLISGRDKQALETLAASLPTKVEICVCDLSKTTAPLIEKIWQHLPSIVINNAGVGIYGDALTHTTKEQTDLIDVNIKALLEITLEAAKALIKNQKKGTILNVSSAAAFYTYPTFAVYSAAKAFVLHFSKSFDKEVEKQGVRVLCVCPGQIATPFRSKAAKKDLLIKDLGTMSVQTAARSIISQIEKQKPVNIIDWRYKILCFISRFVPERLLIANLKKTVAKRISMDS